MAGKLKCSVCEATARREPMPVAAGRNAEPLDVLQMDGFDWIHPVTETRARGAMMVDDGSAKAVPVIHATAPSKGHAGETSAATVWDTFVKWWAPYFGRPLQVRTDPAGAYRAKKLNATASDHGIHWEVGPAEAHWKHGRVEVTINVLKLAATRMAIMDPDCPIQELFSWAAAAHAEMFRVAGASPDQVIFGRKLRPLDSQLTGAAV